MAAKKPRERSGKSTGTLDDPRFIAQTRGMRTRAGSFPIPEANDNWMPQARSWYNSLLLSGQSDLWEPSDFATAVCAAQAYDVFLRTYNAAVLASFTRLSERLGATLSDRKRSRIELEDPEPQDADEDAADEAVAGWQRRLIGLPGGKAGLWPDGPERSRERPEANSALAGLPRLRLLRFRPVRLLRLPRSTRRRTGRPCRLSASRRARQPRLRL